MSENQLQVLIEKFADDDKLWKEALKVTDKDSLKKLINDYDKSIEIDNELAQSLFDELQNFLKLDSDDNRDLSLDELDEVSGGGDRVVNRNFKWRGKMTIIQYLKFKNNVGDPLKNPLYEPPASLLPGWSTGWEFVGYKKGKKCWEAKNRVWGHP